MNSREKILQAIRLGKPAVQPLPSPIGFASTYPDLVEQFGAVLTGIGGNLVPVHTPDEMAAYLRKEYDLSQPVMNLVSASFPELAEIGNVTPRSANPHQFAHLYLVLLQAQVGVAENGALWVDESNFPLRALPFIAVNVAMIIREKELVGNMHEAYRQLSTQSEESSGYGVFIAGPSKTADIEQSLVIGAHGPKSMTVFLLRK